MSPSTCQAKAGYILALRTLRDPGLFKKQTNKKRSHLSTSTTTGVTAHSLPTAAELSLDASSSEPITVSSISSCSSSVITTTSTFTSSTSSCKGLLTSGSTSDWISVSGGGGLGLINLVKRGWDHTDRRVSSVSQPTKKLKKQNKKTLKISQTESDSHLIWLVLDYLLTCRQCLSL